MYKKTGTDYVKSVFPACFETDEGEKIAVSIYPPKVGIVRKLANLEDNDLDGMILCISKIISKNREQRKFSEEETGELFDFEDISNFITDFSTWVENVKKK